MLNQTKTKLTHRNKIIYPYQSLYKNLVQRESAEVLGETTNDNSAWRKVVSTCDDNKSAHRYLEFILIRLY